MPHDHITYANLLFLLPFKGLMAQSQHVYEATSLPINKPPLSLHCYIEIASFPEVECKIPIAPMFTYIVIIFIFKYFFSWSQVFNEITMRCNRNSPDSWLLLQTYFYY